MEITNAKNVSRGKWLLILNMTGRQMTLIISPPVICVETKNINMNYFLEMQQQILSSLEDRNENWQNQVLDVDEIKELFIDAGLSDKVWTRFEAELRSKYK